MYFGILYITLVYKLLSTAVADMATHSDRNTGDYFHASRAQTPIAPSIFGHHVITYAMACFASSKRLPTGCAVLSKPRTGPLAGLFVAVIPDPPGSSPVSTWLTIIGTAGLIELPLFASAVRFIMPVLS